MERRRDANDKIFTPSSQLVYSADRLHCHKDYLKCNSSVTETGFKKLIHIQLADNKYYSSNFTQTTCDYSATMSDVGGLQSYTIAAIYKYSN